MKRNQRSFTGAVIGLALVPVFIGLLACIPTFPVPVGNPERSSVDAYISGLWLFESEPDHLYVFEPYDKRTWLVSGFDIDFDDEYCTSDADAESPTSGNDDYDEIMARYLNADADCFELDGGFGVKAWRTRLGGEWFMTWEPRGYYDPDNGFGRDEYIVFRIDKSVDGELRLWFPRTNSDVFEGIDKETVTRRKIEKIIRRNAGDPDFYLDEPLVYLKVRDEHLEIFGDIFDESNIGW